MWFWIFLFSLFAAPAVSYDNPDPAEPGYQFGDGTVTIYCCMGPPPCNDRRC